MSQPRPIYLKQLELGPMQNFVYLLGDPQTRQAAVVDPGWEVPTILAAAKEDGYTLTRVFLTHSHFDHMMGLSQLLSAHDLPVHIHKLEAPALQIEAGSLKPVEEGQVISIGALPVTLVHTPGHSPGSQCLLIDDRLISGDTLFVRACGRWDLPGGDPRQLYESLIGRLKKLDDHIRLYPGHNYGEVPVSTMGDEKRHNPFLQFTTSEEFLRTLGVPA
ncbi:MAG: MBL fold metallo-hydrolase [Candidatus Omnitrophica bacterium]|nr:MBL fold metallo-hydrolase [Candidatus Omnitrophota bacterium]